MALPGSCADCSVFILPDHGKLMHAFLVGMPGLDAFAHLHPARRDTLNFESMLPPLPGGKYLLFADVVYRSGFTETLTDTLDIPSLKIPALHSTGAATDQDDSWLVTVPMGVKEKAVNVPHLDNDMVTCGKPGASMKLQDGSTMLWMDKPGVDSPAWSRQRCTGSRETIHSKIRCGRCPGKSGTPGVLFGYGRARGYSALRRYGIYSSASGWYVLHGCRKLLKPRLPIRPELFNTRMQLVSATVLILTWLN